MSSPDPIASVLRLGRLQVCEWPEEHSASWAAKFFLARLEFLARTKFYLCVISIRGGFAVLSGNNAVAVAGDYGRGRMAESTAQLLMHCHCRRPGHGCCGYIGANAPICRTLVAPTETLATQRKWASDRGIGHFVPGFRYGFGHGIASCYFAPLLGAHRLNVLFGPLPIHLPYLSPVRRS